MQIAYLCGKPRAQLDEGLTKAAGGSLPWLSPTAARSPRQQFFWNSQENLSAWVSCDKL